MTTAPTPSLEPMSPAPPAPREEWARQLARIVRVARKTHAVGDFPLTEAFAAARVAASHGLNAGMLHALHASTHPARVAIVDARRSLTYADANAEINQLANALRATAALSPGDAIAIAIENRAEYLVAWFAAMRLGVRVVHAGSHATAEELLHMARRSGARVFIASDATIAAARVVQAQLPERDVRIVTCSPLVPRDGERSYESLVENGDTRFPSTNGARGESVVFTSGTTGAPKGALRDFSVFGPQELARILDRLPLAFGDRHLVAGPLHHSAPQIFALLHSALGGTLYLSPRFDAEATLRALSERRIHSVFLVPTMLRRILDLPETVQRAAPTPELRAVIVGSSEFGHDLRREAIARFGPRHVFDFYGATELGWVTLVRGDEMLARPGTVGRPLAGQEVRILDDRGTALPPRVPGVIAVRNAQTMLGYVRDARATEDARRGEWCTVEDIGWLDGDGYLYLSGRAQDMVKSGGVNVYPAEVERVLAEDPQVREVAVIGVPDREWGERLVAVVVPKSGAFDPASAKNRARVRLSPAKVPREWHAIEELPRNANGKVLKAQLRAMFAPPAASANRAS